MKNQEPISQLFLLPKASEGYLREKGSKFYAFAYPVKTLDEINDILKALKKKYYDARHHCYAYRLGEAGEKFAAHDAGEPAHTAGDPILAAIRSANLTWVVIVVVRYFGGTKLGKRGLIEAYRNAAFFAIKQNTPVPLIPTVTFTLQFSYAQTSQIQKILHPFECEIIDSSYASTCKQQIRIAKKLFNALKEVLSIQGFEISPD